MVPVPVTQQASSIASRVRDSAQIVLLGVVAAGVVGGLVARAVGWPGMADVVWSAVTAMVLLTEMGGALGQLRRGRVGVDVVALLALAGALALGELLAGAIIALMVTTGDALEQFARGRARRELSALMSAAPTVAHRVAEGLVTVPVGDVRVGDLLLVRPGEVVPVDGAVAGEPATVEESALTGEPLPVVRGPGEVVRSGAVNAGGAFRMRALATAEQSAYAGIVRMVSAAMAERAPFVRLADRYALVFVPVTLAVAGVAWLASGSAVRALAVLVVATPCPLVLAAPVAIVSGISRAARAGVVVKDGASLEALADVTTVLFDKTGTLTAGRPRVSGVVAAPGENATEVLRLGASLEQASPHVLAAAIVAEAEARGLAMAEPTRVTELAGAGIEGVVDDRKVVVGSQAHVAGAEPAPWVRQAVRRARREGHSTVFVGIDGTPAAAVLLGDEIRTDTPRALRGLRRAGARRLVMVTGDHADVAEPVAFALGLDQVFADRSPAEKLAIVRSESVGASTATMVGDGINDAPALAAADIGVALGARGATASSEAADVVLVVDRLDRLATGMRVARRARGIARQSVVAGMGLSFTAMGFAALGFIPPVAGAVLQEGIDVAVILNALRVLRRPGWEAPSAAIPAQWVRQLHGGHAELRPLLDEIRLVADQLDELGAAAVARLRHVTGIVRRDLIGHERTDELDVYPAVAAYLGGDDPLASMSRTHSEIFHLTAMLERLVDDVGDAELTDTDRAEARRILYGLDAVLRLHFAQEEELYSALISSPDVTTTR
jgi:heavy metal translocating P-type ATPase